MSPVPRRPAIARGHHVTGNAKDNDVFRYLCRNELGILALPRWSASWWLS